jgi:predicted DNA-binding transcriptional regulator AlpA
VSPREVRALAAREVTVSVEVAAQVLGIPRSTAYALIRRDEFPVRVIKVHARRWIIPTAALLEVLGLDAQAPGEGRLQAVP